jgi:hypothetical protein
MDATAATAKSATAAATMTAATGAGRADSCRH